MKTFVRLIRRYVLTAVGLVLVMLFLCVGLLGWVGWRESQRFPQQGYRPGKIADAMVKTADGFAFGGEYTPEEWMEGYAWVMILNDDGNIAWSYALPANLDHRYTPSEVARFTRWYLDDYPVFCWTEDYGLVVFGAEKDSVLRYSFYGSREMFTDLLGAILPVFLGLLAMCFLVCFLLSWRGAKRLENVSDGLDALADGRTVQLSTGGFTGELAEKLNRTSAHLQRKNEIITRRDNARTQWIAGVSHDVRTPLALILGWAEQLERDTALPDTARQKAAGILAQSEKLRNLIDDLNLTSKLEYGAQPLRKERFPAGPLMRELVAQFCNGPLAADCELELEQTEAAEQANLPADRALLERLLENLLNNSVRHNARPVKIKVCTDAARGQFCLTVADDGAGYPAAVLEALNAPEPGENAPHILGLHVVEQIAAAHGGKAVFGPNIPCGAKATVWLPAE